jgi:hypothetical protein
LKIAILPIQCWYNEKSKEKKWNNKAIVRRIIFVQFIDLFLLLSYETDKKNRLVLLTIFKVLLGYWHRIPDASVYLENMHYDMILHSMKFRCAECDNQGHRPCSQTSERLTCMYHAILYLKALKIKSRYMLYIIILSMIEG